MSTITHADGITTVAHTSHFHEQEHANWLRRTGGPNGESMAATYLQSCRDAEAETHAAEHERQMAWDQVTSRMEAEVVRPDESEPSNSEQSTL